MILSLTGDMKINEVYSELCKLQRKHLTEDKITNCVCIAVRQNLTMMFTIFVALQVVSQINTVPSIMRIRRLYLKH